MKKIMFMISFLILASPAWATIYKWTDQRGTINFTDTYGNVPPDYRDSIQEINVPKKQASVEKTIASTRSGGVGTQPPPIAQALIPEGEFAIKLAEALKIGKSRNEAEAESMLASVGIAPKNGWIADYPVTPDIIGELQKAISAGVDSGKLAVTKDEAMTAFQNLIAEQGLPVRVGSESPAGSQQPYVEEAPPQDYPEYYEPTAIDNYYSDQGPPVVTYYPPPPDYGYLYSWVPYPFWYAGFWFPGFYCLHDFHKPIHHHDHGDKRFVSNHFRDSKGGKFGTIDPAKRHMGNALAFTSHPTRGSAANSVRNDASTPRHNFDHLAFSRPRGLSGNRGGSGLPNVRSGSSGIRPPAGYRPPPPGYSPHGRISSNRFSGGPFSGGGSLSHPTVMSGRSFSPPSTSGGTGFHSGGFGSSGFSGGSRGFSGGGGRGSPGGGGGRR